MNSFFLKLDAFRKIPAELTNPTMHGAYLTMIAYGVMTLLFIMELSSYLSYDVQKTVELDSHYAQVIIIFLFVYFIIINFILLFFYFVAYLD